MKFHFPIIFIGMLLAFLYLFSIIQGMVGGPATSVNPYALTTYDILILMLDNPSLSDILRTSRETN